VIAYNGRRHVSAVPGASALDAQCVSAQYPGANALALECVSLRAAAGSRVALVGANGAGKSTLLKLVAGLLPIASGSLRVYGNAVGACHHRVSYLAQRGEIDWRFPIDVRRLVVTGRFVHLGWLKRPGANDWAIADEAIERMALTDLAGRQINELSGGQQQRALLARALAQDADLLLLDEPLNAVDAATRDIVSATLTELQRQGKTALIATHDLDRLETHFDQVLYLMDGREVSDARWKAANGAVHMPVLAGQG
jgi:manganese/zinc/iron transport system ATP- binding protein